VRSVVEKRVEHMSIARAVPVDRLPDVYDLFADDGTAVGRASVQQFSLSKQLRDATKDSDGVQVSVEWNAEFGGYMIIGFAP